VSEKKMPLCPLCGFGGTLMSSGDAVCCQNSECTLSEGSGSEGGLYFTPAEWHRLAENAALANENKRLREALREIAHGTKDGRRHTGPECREIAAESLERTKP
jgi:hypothetical protein